jgi:Tol biopolymer transport system component
MKTLRRSLIAWSVSCVLVLTLLGIVWASADSIGSATGTGGPLLPSYHPVAAGQSSAVTFTASFTVYLPLISRDITPVHDTIAFECRSTGDYGQVCIVRPDGTGLRKLTTTGAFNRSPSWSPDAKRIAYECYQSPRAQICVMNADGSGVRRLTFSAGWDGDPAWSPDGQHIVFSSTRDDPNPENCAADCNVEIHVVNVDGSDVTRLTNTPAWDWAPNWSPDGQRIVFESAPENGDIHGIYVMDSDGSHVVQLSNQKDYNPAWSPDGRRIAFASDREGVRGIYVMNADGTNVFRVTGTTTRAEQPTWSPRNDLIAFASGSFGASEIHVINVNGSDEKRLTYNAGTGGDRSPDWSSAPNRAVAENDSLAYSFETDAHAYATGDTVRMLFRMTNKSGQVQDFGEVNDCEYCICQVSVSQDSLDLWQSCRVPPPCAIVPFTLDAGASREFHHTWDLISDNGTFFQQDDDFPVRPGTYAVTAVVLAPHLSAVPLTLTINVTR